MKQSQSVTKTLPCGLCGRGLDQRTDKNGKPYFVCDPCGTQFFVRRQEGIERLSALMRDARFRYSERANFSKQIGAFEKDLHRLDETLEYLPDEDIEFIEDFIKRLKRFFAELTGARA
jgi:hypothetical protein